MNILLVHKSTANQKLPFDQGDSAITKVCLSQHLTLAYANSRTQHAARNFLILKEGVFLPPTPSRALGAKRRREGPWNHMPDRSILFVAISQHEN